MLSSFFKKEIMLIKYNSICIMLSLLKLKEISCYIFQYIFSILRTEYSANNVLNHTFFFWVKFHAIAQGTYTSLTSQN